MGAFLGGVLGRLPDQGKAFPEGGCGVNTQRDLFRPMCGRVSARQGELFPAGQGEQSDLACGECGEFLVRTPSGWLACPRGHGKLTCEAEPGEESYGTWFEDDP
jgi:hypothetical protein